MTTRIPVPGTDLTVFPLNLGGNTFGWTSNNHQAYAVLDAYVEAGGNFIDTSDSYSKWAPGNRGGESEYALGQWMVKRNNRDDVVLATKAGAHPDFMGQARDTVHAALDASLGRLQTDHIDIYYAHYDDANVSIEDQARTYNELVQSGKVRYIGLSNYAPEHMRRWFDVAEKEDLALPVAIQPQYNLVYRRAFEQDYLPIAQKYRTAVFPYFALASGFLTGKYRSKYDIAGHDREATAEKYFSEDGLRVIETLAKLAKQRGTEMASLALAWLRTKPITAPIASARNTDQLPALLEGVQLELTEEEVAKLDKASRAFA